MTDILMPALSPTMEEGTLAKWLVKAGDTVKSGDIIAEIETDKATMEVEAVDEGVIGAILVAEGTENVKVNAPIARMAGDGEAPPSPKQEAAVSPPERRRPAGPSDAAEQKKEAGETPALRLQPLGERIAASPLARRIAQQRGLDLSGIEGSGPHGRIIRRDVDGARPAAAAPAPQAPQAPRAFTALAKLGIPDGTYDLVPLDNIRKTVARRLTDSWRDVPHFPLTVDVEVDALVALRERLDRTAVADGVTISLDDLVIKIAAVALRRVPAVNASFTPDGVALHHHADIAIAVATGGEAVAHIVRRAETKGLADIAREIRDVAERAKSKTLQPEDVAGGTFSIYNLGTFGIRTFSSILDAPRGAVLSVGAAEPRPIVRDGSLGVATVMTVTLTCDHRAMGGAEAAHWLQVFKQTAEQPLAMLI